MVSDDGEGGMEQQAHEALDLFLCTWLQQCLCGHDNGQGAFHGCGSNVRSSLPGRHKREKQPTNEQPPGHVMSEPLNSTFKLYWCASCRPVHIHTLRPTQTHSRVATAPTSFPFSLCGRKYICSSSELIIIEITYTYTYTRLELCWFL